jgi:hypothetical protein
MTTFGTVTTAAATGERSRTNGKSSTTTNTTARMRSGPSSAQHP